MQSHKCVHLEKNKTNVATYYESSKWPKFALAVEFHSPEKKLRRKSTNLITIQPHLMPSQEPIEYPAKKKKRKNRSQHSHYLICAKTFANYHKTLSKGQQELSLLQETTPSFVAVYIFCQLITSFVKIYTFCNKQSCHNYNLHT